MAWTPAMNVVLTAPRPTSSTPNRPSEGTVSIAFFTVRDYIMDTVSNPADL